MDGEEPEKRHGIRDSLLDRAAFALLDGKQQAIPELLASLKRLQHCAHPGCEQPLDHLDGYYRRARDYPDQRMLARSHRRLQTRTGINRDWGVVEDSILYNREVFEEGMFFWGELLFPDEDERLLRQVKNLLDEAALWESKDERKEKAGLLRVGTGRSRGLGCVETIVVDAGRESKEDFRQQLASFDDVLRSRAAEFKAQAPHAFYFAVTLNSATILRDAFLRYQQSLDAATLAECLCAALVRTRHMQDPETLATLQKRPPWTLRLLYQATGLQRISGWNELWGTPRPDDYALEMGSTFLFASSCGPDDEQGQLLDALYELEESGIGDRRAEGFGRISISDPFHLEGEQR